MARNGTSPINILIEDVPKLALDEFNVIEYDNFFIVNKSVLCDEVSKNGTSPINILIEDVPKILNFLNT